jgi:hypothetical protein
VLQLKDRAQRHRAVVDLGFRAVPRGGRDPGPALIAPDELPVVVEQGGAHVAAQAAERGLARSRAAAEEEALSVEGNRAGVYHDDAQVGHAIQHGRLVAREVEGVGRGEAVATGDPLELTGGEIAPEARHGEPPLIRQGMEGEQQVGIVPVVDAGEAPVIALPQDAGRLDRGQAEGAGGADLVAGGRGRGLMPDEELVEDRGKREWGIALEGEEVSGEVQRAIHLRIVRDGHLGIVRRERYRRPGCS